MTEPLMRGMRLLAAADLAEKVAALARVETYADDVIADSAALDSAALDSAALDSAALDSAALDSAALDSAKITGIETHMSWVFLLGDYAYKLKKPVRSEQLDFSSLERRHWFCGEELRLNRRLAPTVYLDVVTLRRAGDGRLAIGEQGEIVDYLVKMKRLPAARMLDRAIADHTLRSADVRNIALALAAFYVRAERVEIDAQRYCDNFIDAIELNRQILGAAVYGLPVARIERIAAAQCAFVGSHHRELAARAEQRRIVEGHGDLRPEHIFLGPPLQIIDCLEFQRGLRLLDPADELAFLMLECERLGASRVTRALMRMYRILSGDRPSAALFQFYRSHRASIRAKLAAWHLDDPAVRDRAHWRRRATSYIDDAERAIIEAGKG